MFSKKIRIFLFSGLLTLFLSTNTYAQNNEKYKENLVTESEKEIIKSINECYVRIAKLIYKNYNKLPLNSKGYLIENSSQRMKILEAISYDNFDESLIKLNAVTVALGHCVLKKDEKKYKFYINELIKKAENASKLKKELDSKQNSEKNILKAVAIKFRTWQKKDEYENDSLYQKRLREESVKQFFELSRQACINEIAIIRDRYSHSNCSPSIEVILGDYKAESENFPVQLKLYPSKSCDDVVTWEDEIEIEITKAKEFKNSWKPRIAWEDMEDHWKLKSSFLHPSKIVVASNGYSYTFNYSKDSLTDITVPFNILQTENKFAENELYNFAIDCKNRKQAIKNSINLYEAKLDSIISDYDSIGLLHKYNQHSKTIFSEFKKSDFYRYITKEYDFSDQYERCKKSIKKSYQDFEQELEEIFVKKRMKLYDNHLTDRLENSKQFVHRYWRQNRENILEELPTGSEFNSMYHSSTSEEELKEKFRKYTLNKEKTRELNSLRNRKHEWNLFEKTLCKSHVQKFKDRPYYSSMVKCDIEQHNNIKKYWLKHGHYFIDEVEFYFAFTSRNYRKILKTKKK